MRATVYRHAAYDSPWWAIPSSREGRFHRALTETTQYLSLHPLGPAAEMLRHNVGPGGEPDDVLLNLWVASLERDPLLVVTFDNCRDYGITPDELVGDDYRPTQAFADEVRRIGAEGVIVPSAALPGTDNVVLFGIRVLHSYLLAPRIVEEIPTGHLTDGARPAAEVSPFVRWFGSPHSALERWRTTGIYASLSDPLASRW